MSGDEVDVSQERLSHAAELINEVVLAQYISEFIAARVRDAIPGVVSLRYGS